MIDEKKIANATMSDEELDKVAGGTREDFERICQALGRKSAWNPRIAISNILEEDYGIRCDEWNTGDSGSPKWAPAEFTVLKSISSFTFDGTVRQYNPGEKINAMDVELIIVSNRK